ncbi:hypothetical protein Pmani_038583 [Petrolisthes manimaculis]|uniref:Uncharacterized protein n=1 Tax=Petrolisthes manimaculis TaxID=1843537 RepID=A0AAE1NE36_9EUCA|nr:hypothetical protein Pmani_038583 [Petrolisthes manimaculis]
MSLWCLRLMPLSCRSDVRLLSKTDDRVASLSDVPLLPSWERLPTQLPRRKVTAITQLIVRVRVIDKTDAWLVVACSSTSPSTLTSCSLSFSFLTSSSSPSP